MVLEGPVAVYDRVSINNFVITKGTEINYPEKIPVVWNYEFDGMIRKDWITLRYGVNNLRITSNGKVEVKFRHRDKIQIM